MDFYVQFDWAFNLDLGGFVLKLTFSLTVLFISITFLLFQGNSFSTAEITSEAKLSIVPDSDALIAISYGPGKQFQIKNNTGKTIIINSIEIIDAPENKIKGLGENENFAIEPGEFKRFNITADPKNLQNKKIHLFAYWNGGSTEINSIIPEWKDDPNSQIEEPSSKSKEQTIERDIKSNEGDQILEPIESFPEPIIIKEPSESANIEEESEMVSQDDEVDELIPTLVDEKD